MAHHTSTSLQTRPYSQPQDALDGGYLMPRVQEIELKLREMDLRSAPTSARLAGLARVSVDEPYAAGSVAKTEGSRADSDTPQGEKLESSHPENPHVDDTGCSTPHEPLYVEAHEMPTHQSQILKSSGASLYDSTETLSRPLSSDSSVRPAERTPSDAILFTEIASPFTQASIRRAMSNFSGSPQHRRPGYEAEILEIVLATGKEFYISPDHSFNERTKALHAIYCFLIAPEIKRATRGIRAIQNASPTSFDVLKIMMAGKSPFQLSPHMVIYCHSKTSGKRVAKKVKKHGLTIKKGLKYIIAVSSEQEYVVAPQHTRTYIGTAVVGKVLSSQAVRESAVLISRG